MNIYDLESELAKPRYRKNSKHLLLDIDRFSERSRKPRWVERFKKPERHSWATYLVSPIGAEASYWARRTVYKGIRAYDSRILDRTAQKRVELGLPQNMMLTNDVLARDIANRMSHRVNNARFFLGNEGAIYHK